RKSPSPTTVPLRTYASMPSLASPNMSRKPARMVVPSTSVPARKATPSSTAEQVARRRRLWAPSVRRVVRHITSAPERLHPLEHPLRGGGGHLVHDPAVGQEHHAVRVRRGAGV